MSDLLPNILLSVVVPIYNVEKYLSECLSSLANQDNNGVEVLLIDDGSSDNSERIAKSFQDKHPETFFYFKKENGGLSDARNFGINKAQGEYIAFVDSDDYIAPHSIFTLKRALTKNVDILCFAMAEVAESGKYVRYIPPNSSLTSGEYDVLNTPLLFSKSLPNACNKIIKASLFRDEEIQFPKGLWYEDLATIPKLMLAATSVKIIEDEIYYYRGREGAITKTYSLKAMDIFLILDDLKHYMLNKNKFDLSVDINTWYTNLTVITLARFSAIPSSEEKRRALTQIADEITSQFPRTLDIISNSHSILKYKILVLLVRLGFIKGVSTLISKLVALNKIKI